MVTIKMAIAEWIQKYGSDLVIIVITLGFFFLLTMDSAIKNISAAFKSGPVHSCGCEADRPR